MTNREKWMAYTSGLSSPESFVEWSWVYIVSACLQRRVWMGPTHQACFPNIYVVLVGPPGVGKGLVLKEITTFLKTWRLKDVKTNSKLQDSIQQQQEKMKSQAETMTPEDLQAMQERLRKQQREIAAVQDQYLFPTCSDAITYEALVKAVGDSYAYVQYLDHEGKMQAYGHSSQAFSLQELSSLLRKKTEDTVNLLLGLYDCPLDYEYQTLSRGKDRIRRGCLNLIAGTTPSFMQSTFDSRLTDEGLASRTFFVYAPQNRKHQFWIPSLSKEQEQYKKELLEHIKNLSTVYGPVELDTETVEFLQDWWHKQESNKSQRVNSSPKMIPYYARKNIHVMKVAMALHFSESVLRKIPLERFKDAISFLERHEKNMHKALLIEGTAPENKACQRILECLSTGPKNQVQLVTDTWSMLPDRRKILEQIDMLMDTQQVIHETKRCERTDKEIIYYKLLNGEH